MAMNQVRILKGGDTIQNFENMNENVKLFVAATESLDQNTSMVDIEAKTAEICKILDVMIDFCTTKTETAAGDIICVPDPFSQQLIFTTNLQKTCIDVLTSIVQFKKDNLLKFGKLIQQHQP